MPSSSLTTRNSALAATGSPGPATSVAFLATIDFNGQQVAINTGDVTQGIKNLNFNLSAPVEVGSLNNFLDWLNGQFGVPFTSTDLQDIINKIPDSPAFLKSFADALEKIFDTPLILTVLSINVAAGTFQLGVSFPVQLQVLSFLKLENIGILISRGEAGGSPA